MPKIVDHSAQRQAILSRCYVLFATEGYAGVTLRRIAKELGISTGAIYHYFDSKEDIFSQTITHVAARELEAAVGEIQSSGTRAERLQSLTRFLLEHDEQLRRLLILVLDASRQDPTLAQSDILEMALDTYVDAIIANIPEIPAEDARFAVDMLLGVIVRRLLVQRDDDFVSHVAWLTEMLETHALATTGT